MQTRSVFQTNHCACISFVPDLLCPFDYHIRLGGVIAIVIVIVIFAISLSLENVKIKFLASILPHVKFILPTAPTQPVTLNMGMAMPSWYAIAGLDSKSNEKCEGLDDSASTILSLLEKEVGGGRGDSGVDYSRIVLAGFSQGGALALHTGLTAVRTLVTTTSVEEEAGAKNGRGPGLALAGVVVMTGYLPRPGSFRIAAGSETTPVLHCHGTADPVVPCTEATTLSRERVLSGTEGKGSPESMYEVRTYPGLGHSVTMEELNDVAEFLKRVIPQLSSSAAADADGGGADNGDNEDDPAKMIVRQLRSAIARAGLDQEAKGMFEKSELVSLLLRQRVDS